MKAKLEQRLEELEAEYESGQKILNDIENALEELQTRKENLEETMLRISGAIELLEELLEKPKPEKGAEGEAAEMVEVPRVVRQPIEKARKMLEDAGLQVGETVEEPVFIVSVHFGDVIRQNPKAGEKVEVGTAIDLVIAKKGRFKPDLSKNSKLGTFCTH